MDYIELNKNIKNKQFKNIYLFNVSENYIAKKMFDSLKKNLLKEEFETFNFSVFDDKKIDINKIIEICETLPMLDNNRLVLIKSDSIKNKDIAKKFSDYITNIPSNTVVVIWNKGALDKRTALYKTINKHGEIVDFEKFQSHALEIWLRKKLKKNNIILSSDCIGYFIEASGYLVDDSKVDLGYFVGEIKKLKSINKEKFDINDIKKIISVNIQDEIFKLNDALRDKNSDYAFKLLYSLKYNDVKFMQILGAVTRNFENMYICKHYMKKGKTEKDIVKDYSLHPYAVKMANISSKKYSLKEIHVFLDLCLDLDYKIKIGEISDVDAGVILVERISNR